MYSVFPSFFFFSFSSPHLHFVIIFFSLSLAFALLSYFFACFHVCFSLRLALFAFLPHSHSFPATPTPTSPPASTPLSLVSSPFRVSSSDIFNFLPSIAQTHSYAHSHVSARTCGRTRTHSSAIPLKWTLTLIRGRRRTRTQTLTPAITQARDYTRTRLHSHANNFTNALSG